MGIVGVPMNSKCIPSTSLERFLRCLNPSRSADLMAITGSRKPGQAVPPSILRILTHFRFNMILAIPSFLLVSLLGSACASFTFTFPPGRATNSGGDVQLCGTFSCVLLDRPITRNLVGGSVPGDRTSYPLSDGRINIVSTDTPITGTFLVLLPPRIFNE